MVVDLQLKSESFSRDLDKVRGQVGRSKKTMDDFGTAIKRSLGQLITVGAAVQAVKYLGAHILEAEAASAKLEAVLRATGNAAGLTAKQIMAMAESLQGKTGFDDEAIKDASAVLATFRSVSGDTFRETIALALDMSAVFGQDLQSSVVQLGKALEDPITGLTSLRRIGVTFSGVQRQIIEDLVKEGKLFEAQQKILEGVAIQVKGTAEEMGSKGLTGVLKTVRVAWSNFMDGVGKSEDDFKTAQRGANMLADALAWLRKQSAPEGSEDGLLRQREELIKKLASPMIGMTGPDKDYWRKQYRDELNMIEAKLAGISMMEFGQEAVAKAAAKTAAAESKLESQRAAAAEAWEKGASKREKAAKDLLDSQMKSLASLAAETERITENQFDQFIAGLQAAEDAAEDVMKAEDKVFAQMQKNAEDLAKLDEEFAKDEAAKKWAAGWGHAMEEVQDRIAKGFEDLLTGQIRNFRDFAQTILGIIAQIAAQMAARGLTEKLFGAFMGGGSGFGGAKGFVDSPLPFSPGASVASMGGSGGITVNLSLSATSFDPRTASQLLTEQAGTIGGIVAKSIRNSRGFAQTVAGAAP